MSLILIHFALAASDDCCFSDTTARQSTDAIPSPLWLGSVEASMAINVISNTKTSKLGPQSEVISKQDRLKATSGHQKGKYFRAE